MSLALELARARQGLTGENPSVGCVIVKYDKIISVNIYAKLINSNRKNKEVEFILRIPGEEFVVKKTSDSFERSVKRVANSIERLLIKHKKKLSKI